MKKKFRKLAAGLAIFYRWQHLENTLRIAAEALDGASDLLEAEEDQEYNDLPSQQVECPPNCMCQAPGNYTTVVSHCPIMVGIPPADLENVTDVLAEFVRQSQLPNEVIVLDECSIIVRQAQKREFQNLTRAINDMRKQQGNPLPPPDAADVSCN